MGAKLKPVRDLATYWKRERDFQRRLPLIDGREMLSIDTPVPYRILRTRDDVRHAQSWEEKRIHLAAGMLPPELKRYQKVLWTIYRCRGMYRYWDGARIQIANRCGYSVQQYRTIFGYLWHFYTERRGFFRHLNQLQESRQRGGSPKKVKKFFAQ